MKPNGQLSLLIVHKYNRAITSTHTAYNLT